MDDQHQEPGAAEPGAEGLEDPQPGAEDEIDAQEDHEETEPNKPPLQEAARQRESIQSRRKVSVIAWKSLDKSCRAFRDAP